MVSLYTHASVRLPSDELLSCNHLTNGVTTPTTRVPTSTAVIVNFHISQGSCGVWFRVFGVLYTISCLRYRLKCCSRPPKSCPTDSTISISMMTIPSFDTVTIAQKCPSL